MSSQHRLIRSQAFLNPDAHYACRTDLRFERVLRADAPRLAYRRRHGEVKTVIHWGQRKLMLSEIEFLTRFAADHDTVLYAGAAPGRHIAMLSELFPAVTFVLVDPAPFNVRPSPRITVRQEMFTDELAREYADRHVLFISDIRSVDWKLQDTSRTETAVAADMAAQMRWHLRMAPRASMLKFRLPWASGSTEYLDGEIHLPVWGPITTTETRLVVTGRGVRLYDHRTYEEQLFFFNTVTRVALFAHSVRGHGIDHCYDCRAEVDILGAHLARSLQLADVQAVDGERIAGLSARISAACAPNRTLASPNSDPEERCRGIRRTQWVRGKPAYESSP